LTGGYDRTVKLWNPSRRDPADSSDCIWPSPEYDKDVPVDELPRAFCVQTYDNASYPVSCVAPTSDGTQLCIAADRNLWVVDLITKQTLRKYSGQHLGRINSVATGSDLYVTGSYDAKVMVWDAKNRGSSAPIQVFSDAKDSVTSVQIVPDSAAIRTASVDGCVRTYDVRYGRVTIDKVQSPITGMAMTRDEQFVALSCLDGRIRLVEADGQGQLVNTYEGSHSAGQYGLECCVLANDAYVLSGSQDGRATIYDLVRATPVQQLVGHRDRPVCSVAACPLRDRTDVVLTAGYDGSAVVWCHDASRHFRDP
jgi:mitogen-activated protein kinase organizer 1